MKNALFVAGCLLALAIGASFPLRATNAQFIDRITRPCATGAVLRALAITNPNNTGNIELTPCTGGSVTINGSAIVPGGATINPTNTFIPYRSNATTFLDSPLARTSATVVTSTAGLRFSTDNTLDIGATGALRPANGFFGTSLVSPLMVLTGATSGTLTLKVAAIAGTNTLTFPAGTTDFSATGGASQVVKQVTAGAAFTVARLACADLSDAGAGCTAAGATPGGANTQVQFNDTGAFGGDAGLVYNKTTDVLTAGTLSSGNLITASGNLAIIPNGASWIQLFGTSSSFPALIPDAGTGGILITRADNGTTHLSITALNFDGSVSGTNYQAGIKSGTGIYLIASRFVGWTADAGSFGGTFDTGLGRTSAGLVEVNNGTTLGTLRDLTARNLNAATYTTATNCSDSAGAAACGSASAGSVVIDAGSTSVVVSTTAVTANSQIFVQYDSSLGARLSVTCNTTPALPSVTARTAATSFTITVPAGPVTDPACYSYRILN